MLARQASRTGWAAHTEVVPADELWAAARERKMDKGRRENCMVYDDQCI